MGLEDPNTSTTLDAKTISNLPNPGQDLTYVAQFAQGALMNTAGSSNDAKAARGSGNVEFNGLPATSNGYIVEGFDANDNGQVGGIGIAPGVPASAADATALANQSFQSTFQTNGNPCAGVAPGAPTCPLAVNLNIFPTEN